MKLKDLLNEGNDWQVDWSPETGTTGICPRCESGDVELDASADRSGTVTEERWTCNACGFHEKF